MWHNILVNFVLWVQNLEWNRCQIPVDWWRLHIDDTTFFSWEEAARIVVGHWLILQESKDSTIPETQSELFNFAVGSTVLWDCEYCSNSLERSMWCYASKTKQYVVNINGCLCLSIAVIYTLGKKVVIPLPFEAITLIWIEFFGLLVGWNSHGIYPWLLINEIQPFLGRTFTSVPSRIVEVQKLQLRWSFPQIILRTEASSNQQLYFILNSHLLF